MRLKVHSALYTLTNYPDTHPIGRIPGFKMREERNVSVGAGMLTSPISFLWQLSKGIPSSHLAHEPNAASGHSDLQLNYVRFTLHLSRCNKERDLVREL